MNLKMSSAEVVCLNLIWVHTVCHRGFLNISSDEKSRRLLLLSASVSECPTIYHLDNGYVDFFEKDIAYKAIVPIECDFGYFPTGRMEIECQKNGVWSKSECVNGM